MSGRAWIPLLVLIVAGGTLLRALGLGAQTLWFDEALTWRLMDLSFPEMLDAIRNPEATHPPLFYLLLRAWVGILGDSEIGLRSFSVVCGAITLIGTFGFVRQACLLGSSGSDPQFANRVALLAVLLVAIAPTQVHAARQARMYALGTALLSLSSWFLLGALSGGARRRSYWILYGLTATLLCYTHALGTFIVTAHAIFALMYLAFGERVGGQSRSQWGWCIGVGIGIAVSFLPFLAMLSEKASGVTWKVPPSVDSVVHNTSVVWFSTFATNDPLPGLLAWALLIGLGMLMIGQISAADWASRWFGIIPLVVTVLMLGYSFASGRSIFLSRYLTFVHLTWLAAIAFYLYTLPGFLRWLSITALLGLWSGISYPSAWRVLGPEANPGMRGAADFVASNISTGEPVLTQRTITVLKANYYFRGTGIEPRLCALIPGRRFQTQGAWLRDEELVAIDEAIATQAAGVWVLSTSWYDESRDIDFPLPGNWKELEVRDFAQDYSGEGPVRVWHFRVDAVE